MQLLLVCVLSVNPSPLTFFGDCPCHRHVQYANKPHRGRGSVRLLTDTWPLANSDHRVLSITNTALLTRPWVVCRLLVSLTRRDRDACLDERRDRASTRCGHRYSLRGSTPVAYHLLRRSPNGTPSRRPFLGSFADYLQKRRAQSPPNSNVGSELNERLSERRTWPAINASDGIQYKY